MPGKTEASPGNLFCPAVKLLEEGAAQRDPEMRVFDWDFMNYFVQEMWEEKRQFADWCRTI